MLPETRYVAVGDGMVAYQILGHGPTDLVLLSSMASNVDVQWEYPPLVRQRQRLASFSRLIMFDRRGTGLSDAVPLEQLATYEHLTDDLLAVLDAAESERASLLCEVDGSLWGLLFAATYPRRTDALVLWNGYAWFPADDSFGAGETPEEQLSAMNEFFLTYWGTEEIARLGSPDRDPVDWRFQAKWLRSSLTPAAAARRTEVVRLLDVREVLRTIQAPTLVLHSSDNGFVPAGLSRYLADHVPGARFADVPCSDVLLFDHEPALRAIEQFITGVAPPVATDRVLATLLFTDCVGSTQQVATLGDGRWRDRLDRHDAVVRALVEGFGGRLVTTMGDGVLALFDGPGKAIACARDLRLALSQIGLDIRAGIHTGEIELRSNGDVGGLAVHIGARVMAAAAGGELWCSRTVKDLVVGSGILFEDRGMHALKGVPDEWQLFLVRDA